MDATGDFDWQLGKDGKAQKAHIVGFFYGHHFNKCILNTYNETWLVILLNNIILCLLQTTAIQTQISANDKGSPHYPSIMWAFLMPMKSQFIEHASE